MMSYRDMTFCTFWTTCMDGKHCDRALTEEVKERAEQWMENAPIAMYTEKPDCFYCISKKGDSLFERREGR